MLQTNMNLPPKHTRLALTGYPMPRYNKNRYPMFRKVSTHVSHD